MNNNEEAKNKSILVQKDFIDNTKEVMLKDNLFENFKSDLVKFFENPEYGTFKNIKDAVSTIDTAIKNRVKDLLIENELKSSSGPVGKFTLVEKQNVYYNDDENAKKDPRVKRLLELKKEVQKLDEEIKNDLTLFNKEVEGAFVENSAHVRFYAATKANKGREIVADYVDYEELDKESN